MNRHDPSSPAEATPNQWRPMLLLVGITLVLRLVLLGLYCLKPGFTWAGFLSVSDAGSFLRMAEVFAGGLPASDLASYDLRVFPGWPLLLRTMLPLLPVPVAMIGLTLAFAAAVPCLIYHLTRSFPASLAAAALPPVWLHASSQPIAEASFLFFCLVAILGVKRGSWLLAGLAGGIACCIKPYGIFLAAGLGLVGLLERSTDRRMHPAVALFMAALVPIFIAAWHDMAFLGALLPQWQVYSAPLDSLNLSPEAAQQLGGARGHWGWPLAALWQTPWRLPTPLWKIVYVYANVVAAVCLTIRGCVRLDRSSPGWEWACAVWLGGNTGACLCAGPYWGFHAFDRYVLWGWPAAVLLNRDWFSLRIVLALLPVSTGAAAFSILTK